MDYLYNDEAITLHHQSLRFTSISNDKSLLKRNVNSFMIWCQIERKKMTEGHEMPRGEIMKRLRVKWRQLSAKEKRPFTDAAKILREQYMNGIENTSPQHQRVNDSKRPMNAFLLWYRIEIKKMNLKDKTTHPRDATKILGNKWRHLSNDEKRPFINEAKRLSEQYMNDQPDYKCGKKSKSVMSIPQDMTYTVSDNCSLLNHLDARTLKHSSQSCCAYEEKESGNSIATSISPYKIPLIPYSSSANISDLCCRENQEVKSTSVHNVQSSISSSCQSCELRSPNPNICCQNANRSDSVHNHPNNSSAIVYSSPEIQGNGQFPIYIQSQTVVSQVPTSSAPTFSIFPTIKTRSSSSPLFDTQSFPIFPTTETKSSFSPPIFPIYETVDLGYGALPHSSQISLPPTTESTLPQMSTNFHYVPEISLSNLKQNTFVQDINRSDSIHSNSNNSHTILFGIPETQQNEQSQIYIKAQTAVSQVPTSFAYSFSTVPTVNSESSHNPLNFAAQSFSVFPANETKSSLSSQIFPRYETVAGALPHSSEISSTPKSEVPFSRMLTNYSCALPEISMNNPNSAPEKSQFIQSVYGEHPDNLIPLTSNSLYENYSLHIANTFISLQS